MDLDRDLYYQDNIRQEPISSCLRLIKMKSRSAMILVFVKKNVAIFVS